MLLCLCAGRKRQLSAAAEEEQRGNTDSPPPSQLEPLFSRTAATTLFPSASAATHVDVQTAAAADPHRSFNVDGETDVNCKNTEGTW